MHIGPRHPVLAHRGYLLGQSSGLSTLLVSRVRAVVRAPIVCCVVLHILVYITVFPPPDDSDQTSVLFYLLPPQHACLRPLLIRQNS